MSAVNISVPVHTCLSSPLTSDPRALTQFHARQTYGRRKHKGPFHIGGEGQGSISLPPVHTTPPPPLYNLRDKPTCRVGKPVRLLPGTDLEMPGVSLHLPATNA